MDSHHTELVDTTKIEKILLAKRVGRFLVQEQADDERAAVEEVARQLAHDVSEKVRRVLAFELRRCPVLVPDLAEKIAKDVESVAGPFLAVTKAITDKAFLRLLPQLEDYAIAVLARRSDLSESVVYALSQMGGEYSITTLVRNDHVQLAERTCHMVVRRFGENLYMMDQFSARRDLPVAVVERLVDKVSEHCRMVLVDHYDVSSDCASSLMDSTRIEFLADQLAGADATQVHACVQELKNAHKLNHHMVVELANKGHLSFLESSLALEAGLPADQIREILTLKDQKAFVQLMQMAGVGKNMAPKFLKIAKQHYQDGILAA